tara:strand:- start:16 stop:675 length:660 start_codon:yes stop_codon:yes gene_type:complete
MDYSSIAQPWAQQSGQAPRLPVAGNSPFFLKHNPKNWRLEPVKIAGKGKAKDKIVYAWLPHIATEVERAGVNGIRTDGRSIDSTMRQATLNREGWVVILPHQVDYLRVYPARRGKYYTTKFFKLENIAGDLVKSLDKEAWSQFRIQLVVDGLIKPPHPTMLERIRIRRARHIDRYVRQQHIPQLLSKMQSIQAEVDNMAAGIAEIKTDPREYYVKLQNG